MFNLLLLKVKVIFFFVYITIFILSNKKDIVPFLKYLNVKHIQIY